MPNAIQGLLADPRGEMRATPRNKLMGLLADALTAANDYAQRPDVTMPGGKANPVLGLLADLGGLQSAATTAQRVSYGEPLTNGLRGSKAFLKPETADVAMMAPISPRNALAALGMVGGMADAGTMRAMNILFRPQTSWTDRAFIDEAGTYVVPKLPNMTSPMHEYRDAAFAAAKEKYAPQYEGYFRFTNNPQEIELARQRQLRASMNHADGIAEKGLSVADGPHYGIQGYKHGYRLDGDFVGWGSDGEPLLDPATVRVLSDKLMPSRDIVANDRKRQAQILKDAGLPPDYFDTFNFLNDPATFLPRK